MLKEVDVPRLLLTMNHAFRDTTWFGLRMIVFDLLTF